MFLAIVANLLLTLAALGFGSLLLPLMPRSFSGLDRVTLILLGGLGLLGVVLFGVGQAWFSRPAILTILLLGAFFAYRAFLPIARGHSARISKAAVPLLPAIVVAVVLVVTAIGGLAEPTGDIKMDAIAYHFLGPKVWLRDGTIRPVIDESLTSFPATVETLYGVLMALGGQRGPELFSLISLSSILLISGSLALRMGLNPLGAWWAAALIATMPALYRGAFGGFNDVIYSGLVLAAARIGFDAERTSHFALFGVFCGLAAGTKYTGLIAWVLLVLSVFVISLIVRECNSKTVLKHLGIACAVGIAIAAPWYIRNWVLMGCPIYPPPPLLPRFFNVKYLSPQAIRRFHDLVWKGGEGMGHNIWSFLALPFNLTYHSANFLNGAGGIGLAPLALGPFGVSVFRRDWVAKGLALFAVLQTIAWFVTEQDARFLIHVYVVAAIIAVIGWQYVVRVAPRFGPILSGLVIACTLLYGMFMIGTARADDLRAVVSSSFAEKRRLEEIPFLDSFNFLNQESSVGKVLVLDPSVPTYYLNKDYLKPIGRFGEQALPETMSQQQLLAELPRLGVSHILDVQLGDRAFRLPEGSPGLTLVFQREDQRVYRVN